MPIGLVVSSLKDTVGPQPTQSFFDSFILSKAQILIPSWPDIPCAHLNLSRESCFWHHDKAVFILVPHWLLEHSSSWESDVCYFLSHLVLVLDPSFLWRRRLLSSSHGRGLFIYFFWNVPFSRRNIHCSFNHSSQGRKWPVRQEPHVSVLYCVITLMAETTFYHISTYYMHAVIIHIYNNDIIIHSAWTSRLSELPQLAGLGVALLCGCCPTVSGAGCTKWFHHSLTCVALVWDDMNGRGLE